MEKYSTAKKRIIKYSCVVGLISFMLLFLDWMHDLGIGKTRKIKEQPIWHKVL